jgi:hypothetical protein
MSQISIQKTVFNKESFNKVVNTQFTQLGMQSAALPEFTIDDFFRLYEQVFYQIPKEGNSNSHQYILQKEADYLGIDLNTDNVQALLDEITVLRQELINLQQVTSGK